MATNRWHNEPERLIFRNRYDDIPETKFQSAVFVDSAKYHLLNRGLTWADDAIDVLIKAHIAINNEREIEL